MPQAHLIDGKGSDTALVDAALKQHEVRWHWVKGHAGHPENERADQLARDGIAMARIQTRVRE